MRILLMILILCLPRTSHTEEIKAVEGVEISRVPLPELAQSLVKRPGLTDFANPTPTTLLFVENQKLGISSSAHPNAQAQIPLPGGSNRIAVARTPGSISNSLYTYGGKAIYAYRGQGKFAPVLETPKPITAAVVSGNRILFAMDNAVYTVQPGEKMHVIFASNLTRGITSIALDPEFDLLYLSTDTQIIAVRAGLADIVLQGMGGRLEVRGGNLLIRNPKEKDLIKLSGLRELLQKS